MATLGLVLFFVILGVAVLLVALSGGRKRDPKTRKASTERRATRLTFGLFAVALVALGIGVPAAVIAAVSARDSIPESNVSNLSASEKRGRELFGQHCRVCHILEAGEGVAEVGPNLDQLRPPASLVLDAIDKGRSRGNGQMAADLVEGRDARDVAAFVAKAVGQTGGQGGGAEGGGEDAAQGGGEDAAQGGGG